MHSIRDPLPFFIPEIEFLRRFGKNVMIPIFEKIAEEVGHQQIQTTMNNYSFDVNTNEENLRMLNDGLRFGPKRKIHSYEPELG